MWFGITDKNMEINMNLASLDVAKKICEKKIHDISEHLKVFEPDVEINNKTLIKWQIRLTNIESRMLSIVIREIPDYEYE